MRRFTALFFAAAFSLSAFAQGPDSVSPSTRSYHKYRFEMTKPSFGLAKVSRLVATLKPDSEDNRRLSAERWNSLTPEEKFTYCMIHGEDMMQNCDVMPWLEGEQHKVFAYLPGAFDSEEAGWSERQRSYMKAHRGEFIRLLRSTFQARHRVGANLKGAVVQLNAVELIPDLIKVYNYDRKDQDILTVLMLLMKEGKYQPFLSSATYKKLYGNGANYQAFVEANPGNQKLMFDRAMGFYRSRRG